MKEPQYVEDTLQWCNEKRAEQKKKPLTKLPKGRRFDPYSCPCGKATGLVVYVGCWKLPGAGFEKDNYHKIPRPVTQFVKALDNGELPQYERA